MNEVWESIQPQLGTILTAIIGVLATVVLSMLAILQKRVTVWINSKTSLSERELVYKIANEAFAIAENAFRHSESKAKMNFAYSYTSDLLEKTGIKISGDEIKAAIEKAVLEYNVKVK